MTQNFTSIAYIFIFFCDYDSSNDLIVAQDFGDTIKIGTITNKKKIR